MALRIGFDLDGVLADMETELVHRAELLFGESMTRVLEQRSAGDPSEPPSGDLPVDVPDAPAIERLNMTPRQQRRLWKHVASIENFWQTLQETESGVVAKLHALATERRWEIIFLTKRPQSAGAATQLQSQRWLESKGYALPAVYVVQKSRGRIADALGLDIVIDDRPENCLDIAVESKAKVILIWHGDLKDVPAGAKRLGVRPVNTISEALKLLEQLDDIRRQPGIMRSIKRAFGRESSDL